MWQKSQNISVPYSISSLLILVWIYTHPTCVMGYTHYISRSFWEHCLMDSDDMYYKENYHVLHYFKYEGTLFFPRITCLIEVYPKGFWRWCIILRTTGFSDFIYRWAKSKNPVILSKSNTVWREKECTVLSWYSALMD
jgi:hypothetical protein